MRDLTVPLQEWLGAFAPDPLATHALSVQKALFLARRLQERASQLQTASEKRQQAELDRMLQNPSDKATLAQMTDQAFRTSDPHRAVEHLIHILDVQGVPRFFSPLDRTLLKGFQSFGGYLPGVALPLVKEHMQKETANVILPGEQEVLADHLRERTREGVRMNVNFLGEAILSESEAERRLQQYLLAFQWPEIEVVSIKISTLYSQVSALAREHTVGVLCDRLERLFLSADRARFTQTDGQVVPKFVYLDMEEYRDKELTFEAFTRTLDRLGLKHVSAGIALQSYIPDSFRTLVRLQQWARERVAAGGGRVTVRLVKGANMEAERVEASLCGWPQAPYQRKVETDANFKRMLHEAMKPENLAAMDVGLASHNLFDLAYGLVLAMERHAFDFIQFEMLEGMANNQRRALFELSRNLLLYAPACKRENFINAIGYLIRRLDENTGPENFLRHAFKIKVDSAEWKQLEAGFIASFQALKDLRDAPRRTQDRNSESFENTIAVGGGWQQLVNEPDTDFALPRNGDWGQEIIKRWQPRFDENATEIPLVIGGAERFSRDAPRTCLDPSRPGVVVGRYPQAHQQDIARAIRFASADRDSWRSLPVAERHEILGRVAIELRRARGDLMGAALANGAKILPESDPEVSEAVDFVEFYRSVAKWWSELGTLRAKPKGVVVVVSPWNFPIAIPCGGVAAALAAGNTVILKPSSDTVLVAWELCQCFWRAGVSRNTLQFLPCSGTREGRGLVDDPRVDAVVLTGGTATALAMLKQNPKLNLCAETGGKDATIVTAVSDRDQAIKHVLHSAFSHAGQKCSATSLLLLQDEVYDDPGFKRTLAEAVQSISVGSAWRLETKMGPLIRPPAEDLARALKVLEPGEEWAVMPENIPGNPNLWTPGVKYGVRPEGYTHMTEFFGPLLGVMRFSRLSEAVAMVNQTGYGLTSGLESLDEREWEYWRDHIRAGNLYVNRVTTGAVVLRQPFGGFGKSVFGPGLKAGGPNYVTQFLDFDDSPAEAGHKLPEDLALAEFSTALNASRQEPATVNDPMVDRVQAALLSYDRACLEEFKPWHDHFRLLGQDNLRRYLPLRSVRFRVTEGDGLFEVCAVAAAVRALGVRLTVSYPPGPEVGTVAFLESLTESWAGAIEFVEETDERLARAIRDGQAERVRFTTKERVPTLVWEAAADACVAIITRPVSAEGRLELLAYVQEQSISIDYHRYGNLGVRAGETRAEVL